MLRFSWVENVTADVDSVDDLVRLFEEHHAGKVQELLTEYLTDNPDEEEVQLILTAIREEDSTVSVDYSDVECEEIRATVTVPVAGE